MSRPTITEVTTDDVLVRYTDRFFRAVSAETPAIPASYDGKHVVIAVIATDAAPTEAQLDGLETQIEAINGVHKAFVLIGPARIPLDRVPANTELFIHAQASFDIRREVIEP